MVVLSLKGCNRYSPWVSPWVGYSYHYYGRRKCKKAQENSLKMPEMVEFF